MWTLPILIFAITFILAIPLGLVHGPRVRRPSVACRAFCAGSRDRVDTGPQNWKQYCVAFMLFNVVTFVVGFAVLATQPYHPSFLNPDGKGMLSPSMIFHTAISFMTNTNQQHYSGEVHLSYFSQIFFVCWKQILSPVIGLCGLGRHHSRPARQ